MNTRTVALAAMLTLTSCSTTAAPTSTTSPPSTTTSTSSTTTSTTEAPVDLPPVVVEQVFLELLRDESAIFAVADDDTLLGMARSYCELIDAFDGDTDAALLAVARAAVESEMDAQAAGYALGAAVTAFCPEHSAALTATFESGG